MATPHISAREDQIAKTVLMPGDPLRAKFIAENFLTDAECVNAVRNVLAYTGYYNGKRVTVFASGMGIPSMAIYSYELFNFYGVEQIIRIGTAGSMSPRAGLRDVIVAVGACTDSNYVTNFHLPGTFAPIAEFDLARRAVETGEKLGIRTVAGNILCSDVFYGDDSDTQLAWRKMGILAAEMESVALYANAARAGKRALAIMTVSDDLINDLHLSADERQNSFTGMMKLALEIA